METVSHREMRNNSGAILRRVEAGETFQISNSGRLVALIVPIDRDPLQGLIARGEARPARSSAATLASITRATSPTGTRALLDDLRGPW